MADTTATATATATAYTTMKVKTPFGPGEIASLDRQGLGVATVMLYNYATRTVRFQDLTDRQTGRPVVPRPRWSAGVFKKQWAYHPPTPQELVDEQVRYLAADEMKIRGELGRYVQRGREASK